jgi:hypothetical protein
MNSGVSGSDRIRFYSFLKNRNFRPEPSGNFNKGLHENKPDKVEEILLCLVSLGGLLFMVIYWK